MATYAATVSMDFPQVERISRNMGMISGTCDLTTYSKTGVEITDITRYFQTITAVNCDGISDNGCIFRWSRTDKCFHAYYPQMNAATVEPYASPDLQIGVKPTIALTHNADPGTNLNAVALYAYEAQDECNLNTIRLESTTNGNTSIWGETANGTVGLIACSLRFFVFDNNSPNGVAIFIAEDQSDRLEFISPTATDGYIIMLFEEAAGAPGGFACAVKVHHDAAADGGKDLFFDDNGAADAQLCFIDAGAAGGTIPAADVTVLMPSYAKDSAGLFGNVVAGQTGAGTECGEAEGDVGLVNFVAYGLI